MSCSSTSPPAFPSSRLSGRGEKRFEDFLQREGRKTATRADFVFLGIDQSTLQLPPFTAEELASNRALQLISERPFPWSREVWAILLDRLFASGARLVMFDLIFNPPNDGDSAFRAALDRHPGKVVVGASVASFREALTKSDPTRGILLYLDRKGSRTFAVLKVGGL